MKKTPIEKIIKEIVLHVKPTEAESIAYAKQMKGLYPTKQDYGYGKAGHTLNDWQEMREFYKREGPAYIANKSSRQLSQTYRKTVGKVIDEIIAESFIGNSYLGKYCWSGTVESFLRIDKESWLNQMIDQYQKGTSPYVLTTSQKKAWERCFVPLKKAFKNHSEKCKDLLLVFEYTLPGRVTKEQVTKLVWSDVLVVAKEKILVLEFKNKYLSSEAIEKYLAQVNKYKHRLEKYHAESTKKQIDCVLVSTQMKGIHKAESEGFFCSGDCLDSIIHKVFAKPSELFNYQAWLKSGFRGLT